MLSSYVKTLLGIERLYAKSQVLTTKKWAPTNDISGLLTSQTGAKLGLKILLGSFTVLGLLATQSARAESILGIELSPATCKLNPYMGNLRQCIEGNPMTVNFYRVSNQACGNSRYSMTPLQENIISKVIPDNSIRKSIWQQYGRCSGLSTSNYFRQITSLATQLKLPKELSSGRSYRFASSGFSRQLLSLNPGMKPNSFNLFCQKNNAGQPVLTYINVCYDSNGRFGQCKTRSYSCPSQFLIDGNY